MKPETEAQLRSEATRGMEANDLLSNTLLVEAFTVLDERLTVEWANSPARDTEGRERLWMMHKLLLSLRGHISEIAQTGKLASIQLEQERTLAQKIKNQVNEWL